MTSLYQQIDFFTIRINDKKFVKFLLTQAVKIKKLFNFTSIYKHMTDKYRIKKFTKMNSRNIHKNLELLNLSTINC